MAGVKENEGMECRILWITSTDHDLEGSLGRCGNSNWTSDQPESVDTLGTPK